MYKETPRNVVGLQKLSDWLNDAVVSKACPSFDFQKPIWFPKKCIIRRNLSQMFVWENWITKTRPSFYFLPINAQTNISFNLFSENEQSWSIHHLLIVNFKRGKQSQSIKITTRRNSSTLITITYSLQAGLSEFEWQGGNGCQTL